MPDGLHERQRLCGQAFGVLALPTGLSEPAEVRQVCLATHGLVGALGHEAGALSIRLPINLAEKHAAGLPSEVLH